MRLATATDVKIALLKARCRSAYREYERCMGHLDCGNALAQIVSPSAAKAKRRFTACERL